MVQMSLLAWKNRQILKTTTRVELAKQYAGSVLGIGWVVLYPLLLLSIYVFIYMGVFDMRVEGKGAFYFVLFVFCGLIPYIGFSQAVSAGTLSVKSNIHLVKNVMFPIDLVPLRVVLVNMVSQVVSMAVLMLLALINGSFSIHIIWLPLIFLMQIMFTVGLVWILACLNVAGTDVSNIVNLLLLLMMFVSPIGYDMNQVPLHLWIILLFNPLTYMIEMYRSLMLHGTFPPIDMLTAYVFVCLSMYATGAAFFRKFKSALVDFE